jgi:hypothetical protein
VSKNTIKPAVANRHAAIAKITKLKRSINIFVPNFLFL